MEEILKSVLLDYEKSRFLFDLIRHTSGSNYIKIKQVIENDIHYHEIKINPMVLMDIIFIFQNFQKELSVSEYKYDRSFFSEKMQKEVIKRYLKGITIEDLSMQFDCTDKIIEQIFINNEIPIVDNKQPVTKKRFRYRRK